MSRKGWLLAFAAAFALQSVVLYWPRPPSLSTGIPLDKAVHFAIFAVVAALGVRAGLHLALVGAVLAGQAVASEALQALIPGRGADPGDLLADALGIAVGILVGWRWDQRTRQTGTDAQPGVGGSP